MSQSKTFLSLIVGVDGSFFYFREKLPSVTFNYCKRILFSKYYYKREYYYNNFPLIPFTQNPFTFLPSHLFRNTPIIKDKRVLSFCAKTALQILYRHIQYQYISLFLLHNICILLNIQKFLKRKFSHMRWSNPFVKVQSPITPNLFNSVISNDF